MVKKIFLAITIAVFSMSIFAQVKEVTLTVSGDGATKTEAIQLALRSAIEQAFGVFVSANTLILNDELVKDEIATVSSGNIKKYEEVASAILPNGNTTVTLKAIVSISKLITYAQSKGSSAEFAGATFGMNMKLKELNKANEKKAIENMIAQLEALIPSMFDYKLELGEPKVNNKGNYDIPAKVIVIFNNNTEIANNILINTLASLSLSKDECAEYKKAGINYSKIALGNTCLTTYIMTGGRQKRVAVDKLYDKPIRYYYRLSGNGDPSTYTDYPSPMMQGESADIRLYYLRSPKIEEQLDKVKNIIIKSIYGFKIDSNTGESSFFDDKGNQQGLIKNFLRIGDGIGNKGRDNVTFIIPHLIKKYIAKYNSDIVPYVLDITLTIPKDDIMKYNNFTITHK